MHRTCEGFFDEDVFALANGLLAKLEVEGRGGDDIDKVAGIYKRIGVGEAGQMVFIGDLAGARVVGVNETDEFCFFYFFPTVEMKFAKVTDSENAYFKHLLIFIRAVNLQKKAQ
jgi:hypothetical protein